MVGYPALIEMQFAMVSNTDLQYAPHFDHNQTDPLPHLTTGEEQLISRQHFPPLDKKFSGRIIANGSSAFLPPRMKDPVRDQGTFRSNTSFSHESDVLGAGLSRGQSSVPRNLKTCLRIPIQCHFLPILRSILH